MCVRCGNVEENTENNHLVIIKKIARTVGARQAGDGKKKGRTTISSRVAFTVKAQKWQTSHRAKKGPCHVCVDRFKGKSRKKCGEKKEKNKFG